MAPSRRRAPPRPRLALCATVALAHACSSPDPPLADASADAAADAPPLDAAPAPDAPPLRPPAINRTEDEATLAARRRSCAFGRGAWPAETLGREVPLGEDIPVDHVLVLMQENRSFDHYFSRLNAAGHAGVEVAPEGYSNPGPDGAPVARYHDTEYCVEDPEHGWRAVHAQYNDGAMDGFVTSNEPGGRRAMGYLDERDLPFYYGLATTFAIGDRYHCSVLGPTWPNRLYLLGATSYGLAVNSLVSLDTREAPADHIFNRLDRAHVRWRNYAGGIRMIGFYPYYGLVRTETRANLTNLQALMADLASGDLPPVSFIEPSYAGNGGDRVDEHPPGMPQMGEAFVETVVRALMASPAWRRSVLFITYDEHGGFADHVPPPAACAPDDHAPADGLGRPLGGAFDRLGVRVPFIVVSPYARRRYVSHAVYDHTSITRFIEARFGLPAMTARDANATPPMDMFDFAAPPFMTPPTLARSAGAPADARARCRAAFPGSGGL